MYKLKVKFIYKRHNNNSDKQMMLDFKLIKEKLSLTIHFQKKNLDMEGLIDPQLQLIM